MVGEDFSFDSSCSSLTRVVTNKDDIFFTLQVT